MNIGSYCMSLFPLIIKTIRAEGKKDFVCASICVCSWSGWTNVSKSSTTWSREPRRRRGWIRTRHYAHWSVKLSKFVKCPHISFYFLMCIS